MTVSSYIYSLYRNTVNFTRKIIRRTFLCGVYCLWYIGAYKFPTLPPTKIEIYETKYKSKILQILKEDPGGSEFGELSRSEYNQNIDQLFYDRAAYKKLMEESNNFLEKEWKSRILYENTPQGNIIMYYDVYKEGFVYYSDQTGIPYKLLNIVAMKYTITYRCIDFYIDEQFIPNNPSFMIKFMHNEEQSENDKKQKIRKELLSMNEKINSSSSLNHSDNSPFVKFKSFKSSKSTTIPEITKIENTTNPVKPTNYIRNKFIYMGKVNNFSMIQKPPTNKQKKHTPTEYDDIFLKDLQSQNNVLSYKSFKTQLLDRKSDVLRTVDFGDDGGDTTLSCRKASDRKSNISSRSI
jgi:hypothetical protein